MTGERRGNIYIDGVFRVPRDSVRHRHFLYLLSEPQSGLLTFVPKKPVWPTQISLPLSPIFILSKRYGSDSVPA